MRPSPNRTGLGAPPSGLASSCAVLDGSRGGGFGSVPGRFTTCAGGSGLHPRPSRWPPRGSTLGPGLFSPPGRVLWRRPRVGARLPRHCLPAGACRPSPVLEAAAACLPKPSESDGAAQAPRGDPGGQPPGVSTPGGKRRHPGAGAEVVASGGSSLASAMLAVNHEGLYDPVVLEDRYSPLGAGEVRGHSKCTSGEGISLHLLKGLPHDSS